MLFLKKNKKKKKTLWLILSFNCNTQLYIGQINYFAPKQLLHYIFFTEEDQIPAPKSNNPRKEQKNYNLLMKRTIPQDEGRVGFSTSLILI